MDFDDQSLDDAEPTEWFVVFHRYCGRRWVKWLAWGKYSHVSAFGEVKNLGMWVFFDVLMSRTRVRVIPDSRADLHLGYLADAGTIVRMPPDRLKVDEIRLKPGFWCVPAVAHLLGLSSCALRPDTLLRHCLANGGVIVVSDGDEISEQGRSRDQAPAAGRVG